MPKIVDHDERRATIAAAAAMVIADDGVEGATMKAIASRAGVTTGAKPRSVAGGPVPPSEAPTPETARPCGQVSLVPTPRPCGCGNGFGIFEWTIDIVFFF